jgi:hypothetical protein
MRNKTTIPTRDQIAPDTPLRLGVAAAVAYPDGSMTPARLRREAERGKLVVEKTGGLLYTTLENISRMRERCRLPVKVQDFGSDELASTPPESPSGRRPGSSATDPIKRAQDAMRTIAREQRERFKPTSRASTRTGHRKRAGRQTRFQSATP